MLFLIIPALLLIAVVSGAAQPPTFQRITIDSSNPSDPHCKTLGDIDGDGFLDALVASSSGAGLYWYEYPAWTKHPIRASGMWTTDMQVGDIDGDGDLDVVIPNSSGLQWYENPRPAGDPRTATWTEHLIGSAGEGLAPAVHAQHPGTHLVLGGRRSDDLSDGSAGEGLADLEGRYVGLAIDHSAAHVGVDAHAEISNGDLAVLGFRHFGGDELEVILGRYPNGSSS